MNNVNKFGESSSIQIVHHGVYPIEFISMCGNIFDRIAYYINHQEGISESVANHFLNLLKKNKESLYTAYKEGEDCYFSFLQEKAKEATIHYIENTFFKKFTVADIDIAVQKMADQYPEASKSKLHSLKSKNFFNKCIKEIVNEIRDYDMLGEADPAIHQVIKASSKLDAIIQVFLLAFCHGDVIIESFGRHRHQNAEKHLQSSKKINKKINQTTNNNNNKELIHTFQLQQNPTTLGGKNTTNTETVKQIKEQIAQCLKNTQVPASIAKKIQDHIGRIYKKKSSIRQKTIESILGEYHSHTVMDQIQACCEKHKIQIQKSTTDNQKPTIHKPITKKTSTNNQKNTDNQQGIIVSETLVSVQDSPKLLTIDLLIKICQELGYVFWDKKEFTKQAEKIGIRHRQTNNELQIKKKIIDSLKKPEEKTREKRTSKRGSPYQRLAISGGNRMVKQGKVMLRILNHEDYEQRVQVEFIENNKRYDQLYEQSIGLTK